MKTPREQKLEQALRDFIKAVEDSVGWTAVGLFPEDFLPLIEDEKQEG